MQDFLTDSRSIYSSAWAFAFACPILFLIPALVEFIQHIAEMQTGMYNGPDGAQAAAADPLRMQVGFVKTLALLLPGYWFVRYVMFGHNAAEARRIAWPAIGLWLVIFALGALQMGWSIFGDGLATLLGAEGPGTRAIDTIWPLVTTILGIYLTAWVVAWPLGNAAIGPVRSFSIMAGSFWYTVALMIAGILPLMAVHYGLGYAAIYWTPDWADWLLHAVDAVVTGFLALTITGSTIYAARHAAMRKDVDLLPSD